MLKIIRRKSKVLGKSPYPKFGLKTPISQVRIENPDIPSSDKETRSCEKPKQCYLGLILSRTVFKLHVMVINLWRPQENHGC